MLAAYASELARRWSPPTQGRAQRLPGTLVFADISGFTKLTERLAARGRFGAEEMSDHLDRVLSALLEAAYGRGGWLVKWGGDALLLLFEGPGHEARACLASADMRRVMSGVGLLDTTVGRVRLRMSVGVHTGVFDFALLGSVHRELLVFGDAATLTAQLEATAEAGEILMSHETAVALPAECVGEAKGQGLLLAAAPPAPPFVPKQATEANPPDGLIPELVLRHLLAGGGSGEHRQVAIGFLEFSGMHQLLDSGGFDAVVDGLAHVVDLTQETCRRYGVSFHETDIAADGGKILLVAGAPQALADPSEAMLCTIRHVMDDPGTVSLRAGVTLGRVFSGCVGPAFRRSYSVKGDVINLAARIMGKTPAGSLWALPVVTEASRTDFGTEPVEPFHVKGKKAPVTVVSVGAAMARAAGGQDLPMIGRSRESEVVAYLIAGARDGHGGSLQIVGSPGSGKTRLLAEAVREAEGMTVLRFAGEPYRSASPYFLLRALLRAALGLPDRAEPGAIVTETARRFPELRPWLPLLSDVVQVAIPDTPETADIEPRFRADRLRPLVVDLLTAALTGPALIVVDDLQYVDGATAAVLRQLSLAAADRSWAVVVAHRDDHEPGYPPATERLVLEPLDFESATTLAWADTDEDPLPPHVLDRLVRQSGGNPMFLLQLIRAARSVGVDLPDSIDAVVAAQIDRLSPPARQVLRAAAVVGLQIDADLLAGLLSATSATSATQAQAAGPAVAELQDFIEPDGNGWRFRQAVIRDVAYEGLPFRLRRDLHARIAEVLDQRAGPSVLGSAERSLHHFEAGHHRQALVLARNAAEAAASSYANVEAATLYHRALEAARHLGDIPQRERGELLDRLGDVQLRLGEFDRCDVSYARARRLLADEPQRVFAITMKTAQSASQRGDFALTLRRARAALRLAEQLPDDSGRAASAEARMRIAFTESRQGRLFRARSTCLAVLAGIGEQEQPDVVADALGHLDLIETQLGMPVDEQRSRRALQLYDRLSGLSKRAKLHNQLGIRAYFAGEWEQAVAAYREAEQLYRRVGDLPDAAINDANVAEILVQQGRLAEAEKVLLRALRIWRGSGADNETAFGNALLGRVYARQGRFDEAQILLRDARRGFAAQGARSEVIDADTYLAECLMLAGRPIEALAMAGTTLAAAERLAAQPPQACLLHRIIGACHDALGDFESADRAFRTALDLATSREADHEVALTIAAMQSRRLGRRDLADPELVQRAVPLQRRLGLIDLTESERQLAER